MNNITHWEYDLEGERSDGEYDTREEAENAANEKWHESAGANATENGQVWEDTAIVYGLDENKEVVEKHDFEVEYEHYHGDHAEHFHQGDYI